jgi:hypothetical protein
MTSTDNRRASVLSVVRASLAFSMFAIILTTAASAQTTTYSVGA